MIPVSPTPILPPQAKSHVWLTRKRMCVRDQVCDFTQKAGLLCSLYLPQVPPFFYTEFSASENI